MQAYLNLLEKIFSEGVEKSDRTGTGTFSLFGEQLKFDLQKGFPLLTTKKIHFKSVVTELLWLLRGDTNVRYLQDNGCKIWDEWADENGDLGPVYGHQWRHWIGASGDVTDQLTELVNGLRGNPDSRRHMLLAWNVGDLRWMKLPPCHYAAQFYVTPGDTQQEPSKLSCLMSQRSADILLGVPFNIASYALLTNLLALELGMLPDKLVISFGDVHLYKNHVSQAGIQLSRTPKNPPSVGICFKPGALTYKKGEPQFPGCFYEPCDIFIAGYDPHPAIKAPVAV